MSTFSRMIDPLIKLRLIVAYLGEKKRFGWWDSAFLDATGRGFLERPFPRTAAHAAMRSASEAAGRAHDAAIGRVGVFHLFRFPIEREESLDLRLVDVTETELVSLLASQADALAILETMAGKNIASVSGPIQVGQEKQIGTSLSMSQLAAAYLAAFKTGVQTFPYFAKETHD
jgi:hypothetical protein